MTAESVFLTDAGWEFICPWADQKDGVCVFVSRGWENPEAAVARGREHLYEHLEGVPMSDIQEFLVRHGLREQYQTFWDE